MNQLKQEHEHYGLCKCCLQIGNFKNMWEEYVFEEESKIIGQLINNCFALELHQPDATDTDLICDSCIIKLQEALNFKSMIIASQEEFNNATKDGAVKTEKLDEDDSYHYEIMTEIIDEDQLPLFLRQQAGNSGNEEAEDYEEIEFLDEEELVQQIDKPNESIAQSSDEESFDGTLKKKKKKRYTKQELLEAIDKVRNKEMKVSEAAEIYNIPKGTLKGKMYSYADDSKPVTKQSHQQQKQRKLIKEMQSILSYTNAIPFKMKTGKFYCAYCTTDGPFFDNTDTLRIHTVTEHSQHRVSYVPRFLKPVTLNEIAKLDISNLICTACYTPLLTWNDMFEHLKDHSLEFDEAYHRIIPFILGDKMKCALCDAEFFRYNQLDNHMNTHYNNYICPECGDTFLTSVRLINHSKLHDIGRYPCELCGKVFTLDKYRAKHKLFVHKQIVVFKCLYCTAQFKVDYARHQHMLEEHSDKVKTIECEFCEKTFTWRPYYLKHMKRKHPENDGDQSQDHEIL